MRTLLSILILLAPVLPLQAEVPLNREAVYKAVDKSVKWLEADMVDWRNDHGCSACHHGPMYLWSIHTAKRQGYAVNEPQLREMTEWLLTNDKSRLFPKEEVRAAELTKLDEAAAKMTAAMMGHNNLSQPTLYLANALNAMPDSEPLKKLGWMKVADHFASAQMDDGSFSGRKGWPPIFNSPQIHTLFASIGLHEKLRLSMRDHNENAVSKTPSSVSSSSIFEVDQKLERVLAQADKFLDAQSPDETHQGQVLRLLKQLVISDETTRPSAAASDLIVMLRGQQQDDGGWSQTADRDSDAFATGQTLYALGRAGLTSDDAAIRRGIKFLVQTQLTDGTWPMTSRPNPETGKPADHLNPIIYAAAAWATIGLTTHLAR